MGFSDRSAVLKGGRGKFVKAQRFIVKKLSTEADCGSSGFSFVMFAKCERYLVVNRETEGHGCRHIHRADAGDLRLARPGAEVGRATVSYENIIGLALAVLLALFVAAALLFPERF